MNILSLEVDDDHVHIYIEIPLQRSVGEVVRIKEHQLLDDFKRFDCFKRKTWSGKLWGTSYFVCIVDEGVTPTIIRRYIEEYAGKGPEPFHLTILSNNSEPQSICVNQIHSRYSRFFQFLTYLL